MQSLSIITLVCNRCLTGKNGWPPLAYLANITVLMYELCQHQSWTHQLKQTGTFPAESFGFINEVKYKIAVREFIRLVMNNRTHDICDIQTCISHLFSSALMFYSSCLSFLFASNLPPPHLLSPLLNTIIQHSRDAWDNKTVRSQSRLINQFFLF